MAAKTNDDKLVAQVRELAAKRWSAAEIGFEIGKTRNAVTGICNRAKPKIKLLGKPAGRCSKPARPRAPRPPERVKPAALPRVATASVIQRAPREIPTDTPQCLWNGCKEPAMRRGKPYCVTHHVKAGGLF